MTRPRHICRSRRAATGAAGFTLIEVIVVMIIVGVLVATAGMGIVMGTRGYLLSKENAHMAQKVQLAMARLSAEMRGVQAVVDETFSPGTSQTPYLIYDRADGALRRGPGG